MHISKVVINRFRSIERAEIEPSAFNIFVGQNNHGKTNLFEAIEWFYNGSGDPKQIAFMQDSSQEFSVEIEFRGIQNGIDAVTNEKTKESFRNFAGDKDVIRVIRKSSESKRLLWDDSAKGWTTKNFAGFDKAFNDCLPRLEYVSTSTRLGDVSKWGKKTPIAVMLSGVLTSVLEKSVKYQEFRSKFDEVFGASDSEIKTSLDEMSGKVKFHLEQQFPDCTKVGFDVSAPAFDDLLKNFETNVNDGVETTAGEKGDGMQRALMLAIIKTYSDYRKDNDGLGKRFVFLIDEAELHLHPTAQRQLKNALGFLAANGDQVFINTHSSVLVVDDLQQEGRDVQSIYSVIKESCKTDIRKITRQEKPRVVYDLLGGSPSDLLLPQNFMIVEGRSEYEFITRIIQRFYTQKPSLQIIYSESDIRKQRKTMDAINQIFSPLYQTPIYKDRLIILCDSPNVQQQADFDAFSKAYAAFVANGQLKTLPTCSLEEFYPMPWKKSAAEVAVMQEGEKTQLAKTAGDGISLKQIQTDMLALYDVLNLAWTKAHQ